MTNLSKRLLMGLAVTVSLGVALSVVAVVRAQRPPQGLPPQGGANSPQRLAVMNTPVTLAPGFQACAADFLTLHSGMPTPTGTIASVVLPTQTVVTLTFSTEIFAPAGGTVNVDYSIDGASPAVPIGPEFFADDFPFFVTRTAHAATIPPFTGPLSAGPHTIQPVLTAIGGDGGAFFRCFTAVP